MKQKAQTDSSCYQHHRDKGVKQWIWGGSSDFTEVDGLYKGQYDGPDPTTVIEANKINKIKLFV